MRGCSFGSALETFLTPGWGDAHGQRGEGAGGFANQQWSGESLAGSSLTSPLERKYLKVTKVAGVSKTNKQKNNSETPVLDRQKSQRTETLYFVSVCPEPAQEEACISPVVVLVNPAF